MPTSLVTGGAGFLGSHLCDYLLEKGYRVLCVDNLDTSSLANIKHIREDRFSFLYHDMVGHIDVPEPIDMVDIFRAPRYAVEIVEEALALTPRPQVIWMQLGIRNDEAAKLAEANGLKVVMNRCPKIEYGRLSSEIAWMGVNTRTLSAKKAQLFGRGIQRMALNRVTLAGGATDAAVRAEKPGR